MKKRIIPIFVPHRGCPHDCIFCNQKKITGVSTDITSEDVKNIVDEYLTTIDKDANVEIAFFGGSFTAIDVDIQKSLLSVAKEYVDKGLVNDIRMSTRPDCIDEDILKMLKEYINVCANLFEAFYHRLHAISNRDNCHGFIYI